MSVAPQSVNSWGDVDGSAQYRACVVDRGAERAELAGSGTNTMGATTIGTAVPVSEAGPRPEAALDGVPVDGFGFGSVETGGPQL